MSKLDKIIETMISLYCKKNHKGKVMCDSCNQLLAYSKMRLEKCRYGERKPMCSKCPTPCYNIKKRSEIRKVMRYSGPRFFLCHPIISIKYILKLA